MSERMYRYRFGTTALLIASAFAFGCRDEASASPIADASATATATSARAGSCDRSHAMSICSEYSAAYLAHSEAVVSSTCRKLSGTFVAAECPNTAVLGTCVLSSSEVRKFYASGGAAYDAARAQKECEASYRGTWNVLR